MIHGDYVRCYYYPPKNIKPYCLEISTWSEHICGTTKKGALITAHVNVGACDTLSQTTDRKTCIYNITI